MKNSYYWLLGISELSCKIYSGYSWNDQITVDNRFISERVNQLRNWNMNFVHGDIWTKI